MAATSARMPTGRVRPAVHAYGVLLCAGALMPFVPGPDWGTAVFLAAFAVLLHPGMALYAGVGRRQRARSIAVLAFLALASCSVVWLLWHGGMPSQWLRALLPFLFLASWFLLPTPEPHEARVLARWLVAATLVWAIRVALLALLSHLQGSDVLAVRLTYRVTDSVLPYPLAVLPLLLFTDVLGRLLRFALAGALLLLYVWIGYRAGLLLVGLLLLAWMYTRHRRALAYGVLLATMVGSLGLLSEAAGERGVLAGLGSRFADLGSELEGVRAMEWRFALSQWIQSPLFGMGLGFQVPAAVAFHGVDELPFAMPESVGYVHSVAAYMLMDLGLAGLLLYLACVLPPRPRVGGLRRGELPAAAALGALLLIGFFLTQASFRQIQTIMVLMALLRLAHAAPAPPIVPSAAVPEATPR